MRDLFRLSRHGGVVAFVLWSAASGQSRAQTPVPARPRATFDSQASILILQARAQPDSIREALATTFRVISAAGSAPERTARFHQARRLSIAYAEAWTDSFFIRQVSRFERSTVTQRTERVAADSLRLAGNATMAIEGIPAAMVLWRGSLRRARAIDDSAAVAPALLSVGAGFYRLGEFDSATTYLKRSYDLAVRIGDWRTMGNALGVLASVRKDDGDLTGATSLYRRASAVRGRSGDRRGSAADANNLGALAQQRGALRDAAKEYERALEINRGDKRIGQVALNLGNLAGIAMGFGQYARAESLYHEALALHRESEERAEAAFVFHQLGKLYVSRGDYRQAAATFEESLRRHDVAGAVLEAIAVRVDLAAVQSASGKPEAARSLLSTAARSADSARAPVPTQASLALAQGDLAVQFGTFDDAEAAYARATRLFRLAGDSSGVGQSLAGSAMLLGSRGDNAASLTLLDQVTQLQMAGGNRRAAALTRLLVADAQSASGNDSASRRILIATRAALRTLGDAVGEAAACAALGDLFLRDGSLARANAMYRTGLRTLGSRDASELRWRLHTGLGRALRGAGALPAAADQFRVAIAATEQSAAGLTLGERRTGYLADKWSAYTELALVEQARDRPAEAFVASEQMRARQMLDLLAGGRVARTTIVSAQEQDLRRRIAALTRQLGVARPHGPVAREPSVNPASSAATREQLREAQAAYTRLLIQLRESDPAYAALVTARTRTWRDVASRLEAHEILLEYLLTDSASTVFVVTRDTIAAIDLHMAGRPLADLVEFTRKTIVSSVNSAEQELWRAPLRRLYLTLIQPVAERGYLGGKRRLLIAPHGQLHFLPFAALIAPDASPTFLIDRFEIAYTPSATVWVELGERRFNTLPAGVLVLAPNVDRLPGSKREAASIGRIYGRNAIVRIGAAATPEALRVALPEVGVVHLATFGVLNKHNPLFSFIELAATDQDDGRLEVNEVFGLSLFGQLVILSACQTALASGMLADVPAGDDWVGLVQAFLQAGAGSVLATLWPVEDRATGQLMERFHEQFATGVSVVTALAQAQRSMIRNPATARPHYWAGFTISGQPR